MWENIKYHIVAFARAGTKHFATADEKSKRKFAFIGSIISPFHFFNSYFYFRKVHFLSSLFKKSIALVSFLLLIFFQSAFSQTTGDYRSVTDGDWSNRFIWQRYNGTTWQTPSFLQGYPGQRTGTGTVTISTGNAVDLNITPAFSIGALEIQENLTNNANQTLTISGNFLMSAGTFTMSNARNRTLTIYIGGDFTQTGGTITETGTQNASGNIIFNGTSTQTYTSGGIVNNTINFTVNPGATLQMAASTTTVTGGGAFTLSSGATLGITSGDGISTSGASGNIQVTGTRTYDTGANYIYNRTGGTQNTGNGLAGANNLTIDNTSGVTLSSALSSASLTFSNGKLITSPTNLLTITGSSTVAVSGYSTSNYVDGPLVRTLAASSSNENYIFPIGDGSYTPLELLNLNTNSGGNMVVYARVSDANCGGSAGTGLTSINTNRFWELSVTSGATYYTSSLLRLTEPSAIPSQSAIGYSPTQTGSYNKISTSPPSGNTITSNVLTGEGFFVIGSTEPCTTPISLTCPPDVTVYTHPASNLQTYYPFNETSGTTASDAAGSNNASLVNGATWAVGMRCNGVSLEATNDEYVSMPTGIINGLTNFTIATWVYLNGTPGTWSRIFDFGRGTTENMFLTPRSGANTLRFAITTSGTGGEQQINAGSYPSTTGWYHVAVTLDGNTGVLYLDGEVAGSNSSMNLTPTSLGNTTQNWIGRSQYIADPYLNGIVDEFHIYPRALSENEIKTLANTGSCGAYADLGTPTFTGGCGTINLSNDATYPLIPGSHSITWTASDGTNTETCTQTVTVENNYDQPSVTTQPADPLAVDDGNGVAVISVEASGCNLQYQWQVSSDNGNIWNNIDDLSPFYLGTDTDELTITNPIYDMNGYWYQVVIEEEAYCGKSTLSEHAVLTVNYTSCVLAASLSTTPLSLPCSSDGAASVNILQGSGSYSYAWSTGASTASVSNLAAGDYWVDVTDNTCSVTQRYYTTINTSYNENCASSGKDGEGNLSSAPNTYSSGEGTSAFLYAGSSQIEVPLTFAGTIEAGDLLMIIQMQGADIDLSNTSSFGETSNVTAGNYEYVSVQRVENNIIVLHPSTPVQNDYVNAETTPNTTRKRYQVLQVPQYNNVTLNSNITVPAWDGETGGVFSIDVAGTLNMSGYTISADGAGFRGGASFSQGGSGQGDNEDYFFYSTNNGHGYKGEGIAGTPAQVYNGSSVIATGTDYPGGRGKGRGAPGNAGGGSNDADVSNNDENSGGGGGANISTGGKGGNPWQSTNYVAGIGGDGGRAFSGSATAVIMGGGGGGGTANNGNVPYGGNGGGIILIHANEITGTGTISANGNAGFPGTPNTGNDGGGGGGAGGSIVLSATTNNASLTISANGGRGSDAETDGDAHGPGGGGGGGAVYLAVPGTPTVSISAGNNGVTTNLSIPHGSSAGSSGNSPAVNEEDLASVTIFGRDCDPVDNTQPTLTCPLPLSGCNETPPSAYPDYASFVSAGGTASDDASGIVEACFALQSQNTVSNVTTYIYEIYDNAGNVATCQHTFTLTGTIDVEVAATNTDYCPEFIPPVDFNAETEPEQPGFTEVEFTVTRNNSSSEWTIYYNFSVSATPEITGLLLSNVRGFLADDTEIEPVDNNHFVVLATENFLTIKALIENQPGHTLSIELDIDNVSSDGCNEAVDDEDNNQATVTIKPMPLIGDFN